MLGEDLSDDMIHKIEAVIEGKLNLPAFEEAQLRELGFWRWVAIAGYGNIPAEMFPFHQRYTMLSTYLRTGWPVSRFGFGSIFELGSGPLGMTEYLPAAKKVAFDPLNEQYSTLFSNWRTNNVEYMSQKQELIEDQTEFDFAICHNVIDHTDDPAWWYNTLFSKLKIGGEFLFQVNLSDKELPQAEDHRRMHPSPITQEQIMQWLEATSDDFTFEKADTPSQDNEYYFIAWGQKSKDVSIDYEKIVF